MLKVQVITSSFMNTTKQKSFAALPASMLICLSIVLVSAMGTSCTKAQSIEHMDSSSTHDEAPHVGALAKEDIQAVVHQHANEVRACYEKCLINDPNLSGKIDVSFVVDHDGSVNDAHIKATTMNHPEVESCIIDSIKSWTFPTPDPSGTVLVNYPFAFEPAQDVVLPCGVDETDAQHLGAVPKDAIQAVVQQHANEVRACYEKRLIKDPNLSGKIDVSFVIDHDGSVKDADIRSTTINHAEVETCVIDSIKSWSFQAPDPSGTVLVNYPFVFSAKDE